MTWFNQEIVKKALDVAENHARVKAPFDIGEVLAILYIDTTIKQVNTYYKKKGCKEIIRALSQEIEDYKHILTEQNIVNNNNALNHLILIDKLTNRWRETISEIETDYNQKKKQATEKFKKVFIHK